MARKKVISTNDFKALSLRLVHQLLEHHDFSADSVLVGLQPRGIYLSEVLAKQLLEVTGLKHVQKAMLDHTFFRDDFRNQQGVLTPNATSMDVLIDDKDIVLVDDVLFTGRSVRSAIDALLKYGRPKSIELLVLIDRRFQRELPIQANYIGKKIDSIDKEKISLEWNKTYTLAQAFIE